MGRVSMPQGKGSQLHNRREYEKIGKPIPDNIDVSKSSENIILVDKDIKQAYREIFGEALEQYNAKQKRADRKIEDYCDHIKKSKNGEKLFYEDVVQWGSKEDFQKPETRERAKEALVKYVEGFEERNPNLKLIGAYIHMDEASPHLHLDYVPVATGYSRGLETRNSLDKAMKQMGFQPESESRKNNATKLWKENERAVFGQICRGLGLEVEPERKSERKSLTVDEYKEARDEMIGEIEQEKEAIIAEVEAIKGEKTLLGGLKGVTHKEFEAVKRTAVAVESMTAERDQALARAERADLRATAAEAKVKTAYEDANRQLQAKIREVEQDRPSMKAQMEIVQLRKENQTLKTENSSLRGKVADLEATVRRLVQIIREKLPEVYAAITQPKRDRQQPPQKQKPKSRDLER